MSTKITTPELFNLSSNNTAATQLPVFTTSARPTPITSTVTVDYLVVGGGAGTYAGGGANYTGGGGAGGLRTSYGSTSGGGAVAEPSISLSKATSYNITVGQASLDGEDSVFGSITSLGGGRSGATASTAAGSSGGSGGGASGDAYNAAGGTGTANQGYSGGNSGPSCSGGSCRYPGGGGGGAASAGTNATTTTAGNGGDGLEVNIIGGTGNYYAGGGGGSSYLSGAGTGGLGGGGNGSARLSGSEVVNNGTVNTGGGGGGGLVASSTPALGGSGVVILRYPTSSSLNIITTGSLIYTEFTDGSDTVLQFTEGSGNFGFAANNITVGEMIFNSTTGKVEYWDGFQWNMIKDEIAGETPYNNVLYPGDGSSPRSITGVGFEPDLVWIKKRNSSTNSSHMLFDIVRGADKVILSNSTQAQYDAGGTGYQTSFNADGFTITGNAFVNEASKTFVAWCFKAGGAAVANTDGDVESQVSANVAGGFSIVKGTGSGSGVQSVGHGLSSAPELVIIKNINLTDNWFCLVPGLTSTNYYMRINTTDAEINNGTPTIFADSTTVSVRQNSMGSWGNLIAYCFASVPGYSKVGSFVGTGVAGLKIDLDFEPAYILTKRVSSSGASWAIIDNKRSTGSDKKDYLQANSSAAENTSSSGITFNTDGFTFNGSSFNTGGATHMYYAIA